MYFWSSFLIVWVFFLVRNVVAPGKVSCFYNCSAHWREGRAKFTYRNIQSGLLYCTYLVYGFVGIDQYTHKVKLLDSRVDTESGLNNFQSAGKLKLYNPSIKTLLSVGGFQDTKPHTYYKVLETIDSRAAFIESLLLITEEYGFDGVDLAWQFPTHEEEGEIETSHGFRAVHKTMFRQFVKELSSIFARRQRKLLLTLTVLPYIKVEEFIDFDAIKDCVEHFHLMTYDYKTPWRFPNEADYAAPLSYVENRNENRNVEQTVTWWMKNGVPAEKLFLTIPTFGRCWRIDKRSGKSLKPPIKANGTGEPGWYLKEAGTLAHYELCRLVLKKVTVRKHHFGPYAYTRNENQEGMWVSFDDTQSVVEKVKFANRIPLGGVAIVDLSLDDFRGDCPAKKSEPYPILRAVRSNLDLYSD